MKVLDHGYIELIESWGSDERIIESARMSTNKGFIGWGPIHSDKCKLNTRYPQSIDENLNSIIPPCICEPKSGDEKLLAFLYKHNHLTPFEMCGATIEVQAPIFVFREWHRHRTQSYNELSARYTELPDMFYVPSLERIVKQSTKNKQAGDEPFIEDMAKGLQLDIQDECNHARKTYERLLKLGVAREIARLVIPVAQYSRMRASANLRNWMQFLTLRMAEGAQYEIRMYAQALHDILKEKFPRTLELFDGGK